MLVVKKGIREEDNIYWIKDYIRSVFDGRFDVEPEVITRLGKEWDRWERFAANAPSCKYRRRFTLSDEENFWRLRLHKSVFWGEPKYDSLKGKWTK